MKDWFVTNLNWILNNQDWILNNLGWITVLVVTNLITYFVSARSQYRADALTDTRRKQEQQNECYVTFMRLTKQMPDLFLAMKKDLEDYPNERRFLALDRGMVGFIKSKIGYHSVNDKIDNVEDKVTLLVREKLVVLDEDCYYFFTENLVTMLKKWNS